MEKKGIESLKAAVKSDCERYQNCFNENGCDHEFIRVEPETDPVSLKMGLHFCTRSVSKCTHRYCSKYKWVLDRAAHYAEKAGITRDEILEAWETNRTYWYMNYYQECNQPLIKDKGTVMYDDWVTELKRRFGNDAKQWKFVCPACGQIQSIQNFIDNKIEKPEGKVYSSCIGRWVKGRGCDWTLGGLLKINKLTVIYNGNPTPVFEMAPMTEIQ